MSFFGITANNNAQKVLMQALINDKPFTFITGPAGCGKTLVAQAVGLERVIEEQKFRKMIYTRMQTQLGEDLGALPGNIEEKTLPFLAPFMDNLDAMSDKSAIIKRYILEADEDKRKVFFDPMQTMRGRSMDYTYLLGDEMQNVDPHTFATVATRPGLHSKFIFTGNFSQIDNPKLRSPETNGLYQLLNGFYENNAHHYFDHINLTETQRHPVVTLVEKILRSHNVDERFISLEQRGNIIEI